VELLDSPEDRGYPAEYLLSRIRGRRARLIMDWKPLILEGDPLEYLSSRRYLGFVAEKSPEGVWRQLMKEYRWIYSQMNRVLRDIFWPFFLYSELRTLFICLRHMRDGKEAKIDHILAVSLLSDTIKTVLRRSKDTASAVAEIEDIFLTLSEGFGGLTGIVDREGLRGVEQRLTDAYLVFLVNSKINTLLRLFFSRVIDSRNIISLYKYLRLHGKTPPSFIAGGSIAESRLTEILDAADMYGLGSLIGEFSGITIEMPDATKVEVALYRGMTRFLRKEGRDPLGIGIILDYLWRSSLEAMNLSVLFYGKDLERDEIAAEIVY